MCRSGCGPFLSARQSGIPYGRRPAQLVVHSVQRAISSIDPGLPVSDVHTLSEIVSAATAQRRFQMQLAAAFGAAALFLALIGTYGVVAYSTWSSVGGNSDCGLHWARSPRDACAANDEVRFDSSPFPGVSLRSFIIARQIGGLVRNLVFGVSATDPIILGGVSLLLILTAALACLLPASRVIRMEPAYILRHE